MIVAAGLGTRLKPLTDSIPKALVPVAGKPLLEHVIGKLVAAGVTEIVINVHHFPEQIIQFVKENKDFGVKIHFSDETDQLLETGGGIRKARKWLEGKPDTTTELTIANTEPADDYWDGSEQCPQVENTSNMLNTGDPFLVHNVDILSNLDTAALLAQHQRSQPLATLVVSERETLRYFLFDDDNRLRGWTNLKTGEVKPVTLIHPERYRKLAFSGIQVLSPAIFKLMESWPERFSITDFYLENLYDHTILGYVQPDYRMIDVGKPGSIEAASQFLNDNM